MSVNVNELLPIGSVVLLKNGKKRIMITGILQSAKKNDSDEEISYDYIGVLYPEGYLGQERMFLFNNDSIEKVYFTGYDDFERERFIVRVEEAMQTQEKSDEEKDSNVEEKPAE